MDYFWEYKKENILQMFIYLGQVPGVGVSIFFEEKKKVSSRRLKTNMLSYEGPNFQYDDLSLPQSKKGIFSFHQNSYSEKEEDKHCKNYPFNGSASFGDCDKKYLYDKFVNFYKIMPFWIALDLSEVTTFRYGLYYSPLPSQGINVYLVYFVLSVHILERILLTFLMEHSDHLVLTLVCQRR